MKNWTKDIKTEDMPTEDLKLIAERCGLDVAIKLIEHLPGIQLYISSSAVQKMQEGYIRKTYDGSRQSANRLALECAVSVNHIYNVLKMPSSGDPNKTQLSIFG